MITYKSNEDFMNMKKAGKIVATIHAELQNISLPGTKIETLDKKAASPYIYWGNVKRSC